MKIKFVATLLIGSGLLFGNCYAEESTPEKDWKLGAEVYLWAATTRVKYSSGAELEVPFEDTLDNLEAGFSGVAGGRKGKWSAIGDLIYYKSTGDADSSLPGGAVVIDSELTIETWISNLIVGYNIVNSDHNDLNLLAGARYVDVNVGAEIEFVNNLKFSQNLDANLWDGIVGVFGRHIFNDKWLISYLFDAGKGDSDLTRQAMVSVNYKLNTMHTVFGYRYLSWDLGDDNPLKKIQDIDTFRLDGPFIGLKFIL